ncbi:MAG TPA: hypothetical protein VFW77_01715 [Candidatus Saccharimonadales bacterium]|nr:hypothetical protein [Candidatus Saccharimonadales bacterium]
MATPYGAFAEVDETFGVGRQFEARGGFAMVRPLLRGINVAPDSSNGSHAPAELNGSAHTAHEGGLAAPEPRAASAFLVGDSVSVVSYV